MKAKRQRVRAERRRKHLRAERTMYCSACSTGVMRWRTFQGMRTVTEVNGREIASARCGTCNVVEEVDVGAVER